MKDADVVVVEEIAVETAMATATMDVAIAIDTSIKKMSFNYQIPCWS